MVESITINRSREAARVIVQTDHMGQLQNELEALSELRDAFKEAVVADRYDEALEILTDIKKRFDDINGLVNHILHDQNIKLSALEEGALLAIEADMARFKAGFNSGQVQNFGNEGFGIDLNHLPYTGKDLKATMDEAVRYNEMPHYTREIVLGVNLRALDDAIQLIHGLN